MNLFLFGEQAIGEHRGLPFDVALAVTSGKEPSLIMLVVDVITVKVPHHLGLIAFTELVDDFLLSRGEGVESSE